MIVASRELLLFVDVAEDEGVPSAAVNVEAAGTVVVVGAVVETGMAVVVVCDDNDDGSDLTAATGVVESMTAVEGATTGATEAAAEVEVLAGLIGAAGDVATKAAVSVEAKTVSMAAATMSLMMGMTMLGL